MAADANVERMKGNVEEFDSLQSPGADYGLQDDFDPTKYDFYNPISHKARKAFMERLEK